VSGSGISWALRSRQITMPAPHHSVFTGRMPFLPPNQQRQSTEGTTNKQTNNQSEIRTTEHITAQSIKQKNICTVEQEFQLISFLLCTKKSQ